MLLQQFRRLVPFRRVLEIGCHVGPNLRILHTQFPEAALYGFDVNREAIRFGRQQFAGDPQVSLWCGDVLKEWKYWRPGYFDIVFSCYALAYVAPPDIEAVIGGLSRLPAKAVVLAEPMCGGGRSQPVWNLGHLEWRHDYEVLMQRECQRASRVSSVLVEPPADRLDHVLCWQFLDGET